LSQGPHRSSSLYTVQQSSDASGVVNAQRRVRSRDWCGETPHQSRGGIAWARRALVRYAGVEMQGCAAMPMVFAEYMAMLSPARRCARGLLCNGDDFRIAVVSNPAELRAGKTLLRCS